MISEGSCDSENWSNDAGHSVLNHRNKLHFKIYSHRKKLFWIVIIFIQYYCFYCIFDQINIPLVSRRDFIQKHKKFWLAPNLWMIVYMKLWMLQTELHCNHVTLVCYVSLSSQKCLSYNFIQFCVKKSFILSLKLDNSKDVLSNNDTRRHYVQCKVKLSALHCGIQYSIVWLS